MQTLCQHAGLLLEVQCVCILALCQQRLLYALPPQPFQAQQRLSLARGSHGILLPLHPHQRALDGWVWGSWAWASGSEGRGGGAEEVERRAPGNGRGENGEDKLVSCQLCWDLSHPPPS